MSKAIVAKGIDVSRWNGAIDWNKVKAAGIDFALIRLGYCEYAGGVVEDPLFQSYITGATAAGLEVGAYLFSYAKTASAARTAAKETLKLIDGHRLTYPVVFDIEDSPALRYSAMTREENTAITAAFLSAVQEGGYLGMVYASKSFLENCLNMSALPYEVWVAQWSGGCTYAGDYGIWQHSETGKVAGISGHVDLNLCYRDYPALIKEGGWNHLGEAAPEPQPGTSEKPAPDGAGEAEPDDRENVTYTVVKHDTLTRIARLHGVPLQLLVKVNPQIKDPDLIYVGDLVRIPVREIA